MNLFSVILQIQGTGITSKLNSIISEYAVPIIAFFLVVGAGVGLVMNFDKIIDKDGTGTRKEGIVNLLWIVAYVAIGIAILGGIIAMVRGMNLSI